jgi:hypothetical protein
MVCTRAAKVAVLDIPESSAKVANTAPSLPPHPPVSLEQLLATQYDLMRLLMENEMRHGVDQQQPRQQDRDSSYSDFLATQPPIFVEATYPMEADHWLRMTESKFGLL